LADRVDQDVRFDIWFQTGLLAELEAESLGAESALARIDEAVALARQVETRCNLPFPHLLRGKLLLERDPSNPAAAEEAFQTGLEIAKEQGARSWGLRAALSLAKLYQSTDRPVDAHTVLAPALEGFSPTPEMPETAEAQALLAALAERDETKAEIMQRRRLTRLNVAYGNALFAARGYGAPETTAAFARARGSAYGGGDARERLAADYGLWVGSCVRGELSSMRAYAEAFLNDVRSRPNSAEAGIAHRICGVTHQFAGEYVEARSSLERALALHQPDRDDDLVFDFGLDAGVTALACLAFALWPLGEVDRATSLFETAQRQMAAIAHAGTLAYGRWFLAVFDLMRRDLVRAARSASELARVAREHNLTMFQAFAVSLEACATASQGEPGGLEEMRRGVELLHEQNVLFFDGLLKIALAEAEAGAGDTGCAVTIIDEALATVEATGYRAFEAELYRVQGELLFRRAPPDFGVAEQALQTAVAVARHQKTRSFELRAAISLAKLYQSTARPVDAHAVLAPALEGFAPTPEMPEIAEAQALLEGLARGDEGAIASKGHATEG
jgi:predicted ATPase